MSQKAEPSISEIIRDRSPLGSFFLSLPGHGSQLRSARAEKTASSQARRGMTSVLGALATALFLAFICLYLHIYSWHYKALRPPFPPRLASCSQMAAGLWATAPWSLCSLRLSSPTLAFCLIRFPEHSEAAFRSSRKGELVFNKLWREKDIFSTPTECQNL